jgi:hypothetical protein
MTITHQDGTREIKYHTVGEYVPPTPDEIADELIKDLACAFGAAQDTTDPPLTIEHLRAAFERRMAYRAHALTFAPRVSQELPAE